METGPLTDVQSLELMTMLSLVNATTLPTLASWWYAAKIFCQKIYLHVERYKIDLQLPLNSILVNIRACHSYQLLCHS